MNAPLPFLGVSCCRSRLGHSTIPLPMPTTSRSLLSIIPAKDIPRLAKSGEVILSKRYHKSSVLYEQILLSSRKDVVSDNLIELVHKMVKAFGMNRPSVQLKELKDFEKLVKKHADTIQSLAKYKLEKVKATDDSFKETVVNLFDGLCLTGTDAPLVTFSKTMHFLLPNLFMPMDRKYTLQFFSRSHLGSRENQKRTFLQLFEQFRQFAHEHHTILKAQVDKNSCWNRNIPKVIDNIIIAHVTETMKPQNKAKQ